MSLLKNRQHLKYNPSPISYCLIKTDSLRKDYSAEDGELLCFDAIKASSVSHNRDISGNNTLGFRVH